MKKFLLFLLLPWMIACQKDILPDPKPEPEPEPSFVCGISKMKDIENNLYPTVPIGNQCWMKTNLRTGKYLNGDSIPAGIPDSVWPRTTTGACAIYQHKPENDTIYGKLYNFYAAVDPRGLCPAGWRLATDSDWNKLVKYLDADADTTFDGIGAGHYALVAGTMIKDTTRWRPHSDPNLRPTNSSGFTALPGSNREPHFGTFEPEGWNATWWTPSDGPDGNWGRATAYFTSEIARFKVDYRSGCSLRCVQDLNHEF